MKKEIDYFKKYKLWLVCASLALYIVALIASWNSIGRLRFFLILMLLQYVTTCIVIVLQAIHSDNLKEKLASK